LDRERVNPQQSRVMKIMNLLVKNAVPALLLAAGLCSSTNAQAADPRAQTPATAAKGTTAKVIIVDRAAKAITVDVHGTIHLLWLTADAKIHKDGKDASLADITPGQMVSFVTRKTARGDVEVVLDVTIESSDTGTEAAGPNANANANAKAKANEPTKGGGRENNPNAGAGDVSRGALPLFAPPPVTRPIISPHN
jgi:hypothetical protein